MLLEAATSCAETAVVLAAIVQRRGRETSADAFPMEAYSCAVQCLEAATAALQLSLPAPGLSSRLQVRLCLPHLLLAFTYIFPQAMDSAFSIMTNAATAMAAAGSSVSGDELPAVLGGKMWSILCSSAALVARHVHDGGVTDAGAGLLRRLQGLSQDEQRGGRKAVFAVDSEHMTSIAWQWHSSSGTPASHNVMCDAGSGDLKRKRTLCAEETTENFI